MGYWPPERRHSIQTRMNIDDGDDPKFREYGSNWKCGFNGICGRYLLPSTSLICLGSVCVAVARRARVLTRADSACLMESCARGSDRLIFAFWRVLLGTSNGQGGIHAGGAGNTVTTMGGVEL